RWLDEVYAERNYDLTIIGLTGKIDPHHELRRYESTYYRNFMNFQHEEYDELIRLGARTTDPDLRMDRYQHAQEILAFELPALFLMVPQEIVGVRSDIDGWT